MKRLEDSQTYECKIILYFALLTLFPLMACTTTSYHPIKQRYEIITLADIPIGVEIKQTSKASSLASEHSFFTPKLNETHIAFDALNGKAERSTYIEGYFRSLQIPILYFQKDFIGRKVVLTPKILPDIKED